MTHSSTCIVLIGPRGSGKTTVARLLAERLGWNWIDADALLEERAGRSIRTLFAEEGEAGFRDREAALLGELLRRDRHVLATGGGVVVRPENRHLLQAQERVIWLTGDIDSLWTRISGDATTAERRPNLTTGGREEIAQIVAQRESLYRACARFQVDTGHITPEDVVETILAWLSAQ
ncbi:MAG: shikimate kinase [Gemmataceae bacterium]